MDRAKGVTRAAFYRLSYVLRPATVLSLAGLTLLTWGFVRSKSAVEIFVWRDPLRHFDAITFQPNGVSVVWSRVPTGGLNPLAVQRVSGPTQWFWYDGTMDIPPHFRWRALGVRYSQSKLSIWPFNQLLLPYWLPMCLFALAPASAIYRLVVVMRRWRGKMCVHCGYDCRETPELCPECGRKPELVVDPRVGQRWQRAWAIVLLIAASVWLVRWTEGRRHRRELATEREVLNRRVPRLRFKGMPLSRVLQAISRQTGVTFVLSPAIATRPYREHLGSNMDPGDGTNWQTPVTLTVVNGTMDETLQALMFSVESDFMVPLEYEVRSDGNVFLGAHDEIPAWFEIDDVRALSDRIRSSAIKVRPFTPDPWDAKPSDRDDVMMWALPSAFEDGRTPSFYGVTCVDGYLLVWENARIQRQFHSALRELQRIYPDDTSK